MRIISALYSMRVNPSLSDVRNCSSRFRPPRMGMGARTVKRTPLGCESMKLTTSSTLCLRTSLPLTGDMVWPMRANSSLRYS